MPLDENKEIAIKEKNQSFFKDNVDTKHFINIVSQSSMQNNCSNSFPNKYISQNTVKYKIKNEYSKLKSPTSQCYTTLTQTTHPSFSSSRQSLWLAYKAIPQKNLHPVEMPTKQSASSEGNSLRNGSVRVNPL